MKRGEGGSDRNSPETTERLHIRRHDNSTQKISALRGLFFFYITFGMLCLPEEKNNPSHRIKVEHFSVTEWPQRDGH